MYTTLHIIILQIFLGSQPKNLFLSNAVFCKSLIVIFHFGQNRMRVACENSRNLRILSTAKEDLFHARSIVI